MERLKRLCEMPQGDKFQARKGKEDDAEYPIWQRSSHSIQGVAVMVQHTGRLRVLLVRLPLKRATKYAGEQEKENSHWL